MKGGFFPAVVAGSIVLISASLAGALPVESCQASAEGLAFNPSNSTWGTVGPLDTTSSCGDRADTHSTDWGRAYGSTSSRGIHLFATAQNDTAASQLISFAASAGISVIDIETLAPSWFQENFIVSTLNLRVSGFFNSSVSGGGTANLYVDSNGFVQQFSFAYPNELPVSIPVPVILNVGRPTVLRISGQVVATAAAPFSMGRADLSQTITLSDVSVFDLPDGFTVNSPSAGISNNEFSGFVVPEPSVFCQMGFGAALLAVLARRRRTAAVPHEIGALHF